MTALAAAADADAGADATPTVPTVPTVRRFLSPALITVVVVNVALAVWFYNRGWIAADDGQYAHVADRLGRGEVLNADIEELHPGYVHFIHALSLKLFGHQIVSLRYPLMALMTAQSLVTYHLFGRARRLTAVAAALTMTAIGTLQIADPTPSLYALAITVALMAVIHRSTPETRYRALAIGLLLGLVFLFRQLSAVFVAMGVLAFLFTERRPEGEEPQGNTVIPRGVLVLSLVGLIGYLATSTDLTGGLLFGLYPLLILGWALRSTTIGSRSSVLVLARIGGGALLSAVPLVAYHLWNGSLAAWARDTFVRSLTIQELDHLSIGRYFRDLVIRAIPNVLAGSLTERLNGVYWIVLVFAGFAIGARLVVGLRRHARTTQAGIESDYAVPFVAVFYALVSVFNQIPYYLYLSAGLSVTAWLWMSHRRAETPTEGVPARESARTTAIAGAAIALALVGVVFHAGQPYFRTYGEIVRGDRIELVQSRLPNLGLWIDPAEETRYEALIGVIERETQPGDVIFAVPNSAELYFLSGRDNGFAFFNPAIGVRNDAELADFIVEYQLVAPSLVVHDTASPYNTEIITRLLETVLVDYEHVATIETFEVYSRR